jgi:hypothetical protein
MDMSINFIKDGDGIMVPQFEFEVRKQKNPKKNYFFKKKYKRIRLLFKRIYFFGWDYKKILRNCFISAAD